MNLGILNSKILQIFLFAILLILPTKTYTQESIYHKGWNDLNKNGQKDIYEDPQANIDDRIDDLINQMNIEEKTCQMVTLYGYKRVLKDDLPTEDWKNEIWKDGLGALDEHLNGFQGWGKPPMEHQYCWPASNHAWALNQVQKFFIEDTRLGIPVDFTNEGIRGIESYKATNFPTQLALGQTWNKELINKIGEITGKEARLLGYTNVYSPILDVARDQRWGRMEEVYGESPFLVAELGIEMTKGLQKDFQVASTAKHYAIYSNNKGAREGFARVDPQVTPRETELVHLYPFGRVIKEAGLLGVMSSYNDYDGIPIQSSNYYLTEVLRNRFGFKGYVVSDSDAIMYLYNKHKTAGTYKEAVRQSVEAGLNIRCTFRSPKSFIMPLRELISDGAISEETIDARIRDVLRVKFMIGLFDHPYVADIEEADRIVNCEEHQKVALQASRESIILLKNENSILPLKKENIKRITVCGPNANNGEYALTHYGPLGVDVSTVFEGVKIQLGENAEVVYHKGCNLVDDNWPDSEIMPTPLSELEKEEINKAVKSAQESDVAIVVVGGSIRTCGENKSRSSLNLPGRQLDLIKAVYNTGTPTVVVIISGRPLTINWTVNNVPAILQAFYPGSQGGIAVADVLFGEYNPGGKLTVTMPKTVGQLPFNFPVKPSAQLDAWGKAGPEGSRARVNGVLYPFGYGLSFTDFEYSNLKISPEIITPDQKVKVTFDIKNIGEVKGNEVVQLYIRDIVSSVTTYEKVLRNFERISLEPNELKHLEFEIEPADLELLNKNMDFIVEPGEFLVMLAASSEDVRLKKKLLVVEADKMDEAIKRKDHLVMIKSFIQSSGDEDQLVNLVDGKVETFWEISKKEVYIDFELKDKAVPKEIIIDWRHGEYYQFNFEIQLSGGGGQFISVYEGKSSGNTDDPEKYEFEGFPASDLRIIFYGNSRDNRTRVSEIILKEFKGNK